MKDFTGYLAPHKALIAGLLLCGVHTRDIARILYERGVRTYGATDRDEHVGRMAAMISHLNARWEGRFVTPGERRRRKAANTVPEPSRAPIDWIAVIAGTA